MSASSVSEEGGTSSAGAEASPEQDARVQHSIQAAAACRNFALSFQRAMADADLRAAVGGALQAEKLSAAMAATTEAELDTLFSNAQHVLREATGYSSWLLAPEEGMRGLLAAGIDISLPPLLKALAGVHAGLQAWAKAHVERLGLQAEQEALKEQLLALAKGAITEWHAETEVSVRRLLEAEKRVSPATFAALRQQLAQLSTGGCAAAREPAGRAAAGKGRAGARAAAAAVCQASPGRLTSYWMGWLDKQAARTGLWQRRWCVLSLEEGTLSYWHKPEAKARPRAVLHLHGASVLHSPEGSTTFTIQTGLPAPGAPRPAAAKHSTETLTLRADSAGVAAQWREFIAAASTAAPSPSALGAAKLNGSTAGRLHALESEECSGNVERKISTAVFQDRSPGTSSSQVANAASAAALSLHGPAEGQGGDAAADAATAAQQAALLAEIEGQAAQLSPSALERAQLALILPAVRESLQDAFLRLADLAPKIISTGMLGRHLEFHDRLLGVLHG